MLYFKPISYEQTKPFILNKHYAHRMPSISFSFGLYYENVLHGVLTFGTPASPSLCKGIAGENFKSSVIELNRLYIDDEVSQKLNNVASQFISFGLKQLKPLNKIVVSYADSGMNHTGFVYQSCNFMYTGKTKSRTDIYSGLGKHSRHYKKGKSEKYRVIRTSKYRYVYICGDKRFKKKVMLNLNYPIIKSYPKADDKHYHVGDTEPTMLINTSNGQIVKADSITINE